jgi:hypothetical protein
MKTRGDGLCAPLALTRNRPTSRGSWPGPVASRPRATVSDAPARRGSRDGRVALDAPPRRPFERGPGHPSRALQRSVRRRRPSQATPGGWPGSARPPRALRLLQRARDAVRRSAVTIARGCPLRIGELLRHALSQVITRGAGPTRANGGHGNQPCAGREGVCAIVLSRTGSKASGVI